MSPYLRFYTTAIQDALIYRWNLFFAVFGYSLSAVVGIHIVQRVYETGHQLGTYSEQSILIYFLLVLAMDGLLYWGDAWNIVDEIHSGKIVNFLVKPVSFYHSRIAIYLGKMTIRVLTLLPALTLGWFLLHLQPQTIAQFHPLVFLPYFILGLSMHICIVILLGVLSFPLQRSSAGIHTFQTLTILTSGKLLPLSLFPVWATHVLQYLPFHFLTYTPLSQLIGKNQFVTGGTGLFIGLGWLGLILLGMGFVWQRGMKTYEGFGQ